ncbi:MAG TPA: glycoside hydrolase family 88 protein [Lachnospiraceae bacterium]|nr:glycoside hydrolase family 88 protein [Lachnospiraceae bacterium]
MNSMSNNYKEILHNALEAIAQKLDWVCDSNKDGIPYTVTDTGKYNNMSEASLDSVKGEESVSWWTNGFFGGLLWQMYQLTGDKKYFQYARVQEKKLDACFSIFDHINHDVGFMWLLTAVADYRLTGDITARRRGLHAATILAGRFNINGNYIRAWDGKDNAGWAIIDCLMNLSLLYWATKETGDPRFAAIANAHADTAMKYFVREDGSVCHIVEFDPLNGEFIKSHGGQGYQEGSCWTRGQAWALYGFTNGYRNTQNENYLSMARKTADFFLGHLPESYLVPVDFRQPQEPAWEDSSAACIAASGMLDLAKCLPKEEGKKYHDGALRILGTLWEKRICTDDTLEALVTKCAVAYHDDKKVNTLIYADYFFLEALMKLEDKAISMW